MGRKGPGIDRFDDSTTLTTPSPVGERRLRLVVFVAGGVTEYDLPTDGVSIVGRSSAAEIHIDQTSVSREHARLRSHEGSLSIEDLGSTNGTFVNNEVLDGRAVTVRVGDALRFGDVAAEVRGVRESRLLVARFVGSDELVARAGEEADRCMQYDRSITGLSVAIDGADARQADKLKDVLVITLRALDLAAELEPGRVDALITECNRQQALEVAERVQRALARRKLAARIGVATFPGDVPSPESLWPAARAAMGECEAGGISAATEGARIIHVGDHEVIVADEVMLRLFALVERMASTPFPVLIHGETGSGKEIVAEALHHLGERAGAALVKINCAALPENLLESELFGHEAGAFSGADQRKRGLFEEAHEGSLFLDEIGEMSPGLQAKLLRVLEDGRVRRVGATTDIQVDARIIAATHRDLKSAVGEGTFREDLYYRLNAMLVRLPPLRKRRREISLLAERFVAEAARRVGRNPPVLRPEVLEALQAHEWPGNIRELRNVMSAAAMLCEGAELTLAHLPQEIGAESDKTIDESARPDASEAPGQVPLMQEIRELEERRIRAALRACGGNRTQAADMLGMPRRTLMHKIRTLEIDIPAPATSSRGSPTLK